MTFRSDASDELGTTLRRAGIPREFTVSKAGPQNHDTVGSVERGVRELKEGLAVLRLELGKAGVDVVNSLVGWEASSRYVITMHNLHSKLDGTGLSGREVLRNQVDQKNAVTAMFCSRVLAETPDSVNSIGRFVTAGYLYPVRNSFAHFVVASIEGELKFFQAKSLKLVFPIVYPLELVGRFLRAVDSAGPAPAILDQEPIEIVPEDFARLPDKVQPPRHWIDAHGRTEGCSSCATRQGRLAPAIRLSAARGKVSSCLLLSSRRLRMWSKLWSKQVKVETSPTHHLWVPNMLILPMWTWTYHLRRVLHQLRLHPFRSETLQNFNPKMLRWKLSSHRRSR